MTQLLKITVLTLVSLVAIGQDINYSEFVDLRIGLQTGRTYLAAQVPFGMVTPGPHYVGMRTEKIRTDSIGGFSHLHANGVGCGDEWGSIYTLPFSGTKPQFYARHAVKNEKAIPGLYECTLEPGTIRVQLTATQRTALHRYTFKPGNQYILVDLSRHLNEKFGQSTINILSPTSAEGVLSEGTFCAPNTSLHSVYFYIELSSPCRTFGTADSGKVLLKTAIQSKNAGAWFQYSFVKETTVEMRIGLSFTSSKHARENLKAELSGKTFEQVSTEAAAKWNSLLGRVHVEGGSTDEATMLYSALYRMLLHPNVYDDANGDYLSASPWPAVGARTTMTGKGFTRYTLFSLWDTYRNLHPYFCLLYPEYQTDMVKSALEIYRERGWLPKWEHHGNEGFNMNGAPASIMIADSYIRGLPGLDSNLIFEAILKENEVTDSTSSERNRPGQEVYKRFGGWIPQEYVNIKPPVWGPVSTTLEYNLADWSFAQFCKKIGKPAEAEVYEKRSKGYRNFFHPQLQLLAPRRADKTWYTPFDPNTFTMFCADCPYVEGNAWNYTFAAPHDVQGLMSLFGYPNAFAAQLIKCFNDGKFQIGNEPDIHYPFLFNFVKGEEWRTQYYVRDIISKKFNATMNGIPGEEDAGTLSAWLFGGMIGFYPMCPGNPEYQLTTPYFRKTLLKLTNGNTITIETPNLVSGYTKIRSLNWNDKKLSKFAIPHAELQKGGTLLIETVE